MKTFMIIERFKPGKAREIYIRLDSNGRMLPADVLYIDSWIEETLQKCYQVMKSDSIIKIYEWTENWKDLIDFEVIPVLDSLEAKDALKHTG